MALYAPNAQTRADVSRGSRRIELVPVTGTTATLAEIRDLNIVDGSFFTAADDAIGAQVAVIGADVNDTLFDAEAAVGGAIRIAGRRFQVIGVQGRVGSGGTGSVDKYVWIPMRAYERAFGAPRSLQLFAKAASGTGSDDAEDHARISLRAARSLAPGTADNFDVLAPEAARGFVANLSSRIGAAAGPISLMALLAAIVVVTNTVLVSVTQRTREIGLRRALGATRTDIVREVLAEAAILGTVGGAAGAMAVLALIGALARVAPVPLSIEPATLGLALAAAAGSGVAAGWLPAMRATRLDVITAIRTE
jgi:putative ABC transport system permease protein